MAKKRVRANKVDDKVTKHPSSKGLKTQAKPAVIDVVCRKVMFVAYLEHTRDGKFAGDFDPVKMSIAEADFETSYNLKKIVADLCRKAKVQVEKGKV